MVCSYSSAEASGQDWGVILATPKSSSPLQAIEKKRFRSVPIRKLATPFGGRQAFGRNGKLLGNSATGQVDCRERYKGSACI